MVSVPSHEEAENPMPLPRLTVAAALLAAPALPGHAETVLD